MNENVGLTKSTDNKKKFTWLLILQGWAMLWVVIGHSPLGLAETPIVADNGHWLDVLGNDIARICFTFAYSFHMPLFIMISGYLFYLTRVVKNVPFKSMAKEKWVRLGIPYVFIIFLGIAIKLVYSQGRPLDMSFMGFINNFIKPFNGAMQEMWFIAVLFLFFLAYPLYKTLMRNRLLTVAGLCVALAVWFIPSKMVTDVFSLNKAVKFFIYFYIGMCIASWNLQKYIESLPALSASLMVFILTTWHTVPIITPLSGCFFFWGLAVIVDKKLTSSLFKSFRNYTYQIFLIGIFAQIAVKVLYSKFAFPGSYLLYWTVCILAGVYFPVLVSKCMEKFSNSRIGKLKVLLGL